MSRVKNDKNTPDPQPGCQLDQLINALRSENTRKQHANALQIGVNCSAEDFYSKVDNLQEHYFETISNLRKNNLENHHYLWLLSVDTLVSELIKFKTFYDNQLINNFQYNLYGQNGEINSIISAIGLKLGKLCGDLGEILSQFINLNILKLEKFVCINDSIFNIFKDVIIKSLEVLIIDKSEEARYIDNAPLTLKAISHLVAHLYDFIKVTHSHEIFIKSFPILVKTIKVIYKAGDSQLVLPFLESGVVNPNFPIVLIRTSTLEFIDLINYYKFTAFNLLTLALAGDSINDDYSKQASIYFKVLLNFPNLDLQIYNELVFSEIQQDYSHNYEDENNIPYQEMSLNKLRILVSIEERQEISLLFALNYLIGLNSLHDLVNSNSYFKPEVAFLVTSLSTFISTDLDKSASRSSSSHSSSNIALQPLGSTHPRKKQFNKLKFKSLSAIFNYGTYKEKLSLVVNFFELFIGDSINVSKIISRYSFANDSNSIENQFEHLVSNIDDSHYPGKVFYAMSLFKIRQLIKCLSIKHLVSSGGINNIPLKRLNDIFESDDDIKAALRVKDVLKVTQYADQGDKILHFEPVYSQINESEESIVSSQLGIFERTKELQSMTSALNS